MTDFQPHIIPWPTKALLLETSKMDCILSVSKKGFVRFYRWATLENLSDVAEPLDLKIVTVIATVYHRICFQIQCLEIPENSWLQKQFLEQEIEISEICRFTLITSLFPGPSINSSEGN